MANKKTVIFVGSFISQSEDGGVGGLMFACRSLINSDLTEVIDWKLIDTTAETNLPRPFYRRMQKSFFRIYLFIKYLLTKNVEAVLLFTSYRFSFIEKGLMALLAKAMGKQVVLAPRSGMIELDVKYSWFMRKFIFAVIKRVNWVVCQGEYWKTFYSNIYDKQPHKFIVIPNWFDLENYPVIPKGSISEGEKIKVLFLGSITKNKGIFDLIAAAELLKDKYPNIEYKIAGNGLSLNDCKTQIAQKGLSNQFEFLGWVVGTQKIELLKACNIYVMPSYFEGFPNSVLEAMASKMAIVSTNISTIPEVVEHNVNGLLFQAGKIDQLAQHLEALYSNSTLIEKLVQAGHSKLKQSNSLENAVSNFKKILVTS